MSNPNLTAITLNLNSIITTGWAPKGDRYYRGFNLTVWKGAVQNVPFYHWVTGGASKPFGAASYRLLVNDVPVATATPPAGASEGTFSVDLSHPAIIDKQWAKVQVECTYPETSPPIYVFINRDDVYIDNPPAMMPVWTGSYALGGQSGLGSRYQYGMVPAVFAPEAKPLPPRECPEFSDPIPNGQLFRENLAPPNKFDVYRTNRSRKGIVSSHAVQAYKWSNFVAKYPQSILLDGPRGVAVLSNLAHAQLTRHGGAWCCDPWRVFRVDPDGNVETRAGWRHRNPPPYHGEAKSNPIIGDELELVGDWSAIPPERHGFHEIWGFAWDQRTLTVDENAPLVCPPANRFICEHPHHVGPVGFVADSQNNRIVKLQFNATDHEPPKVTEFLVGLGDPWDCVCVDGVLYVSERTNHKINAYDATTGAFVRTVAQGADLAYVSHARQVMRRTTIEIIRQEACVAPEGLYHLDGWLYFGSKAMGQIRRINLTTGEIRLITTVPTGSPAEFVKIAVSDGTFGPRGTVFYTIWSVNERDGFPVAVLPDGTRWKLNGFNKAQDRGRGGNWSSLGYNSAVGVGMGRLIFGSVAEGLVQLSMRLPTDPAINQTRLLNGYNKYRQEWLITHGPGGYGYCGLPLPWGEDPDLDYFLEVHGHARPDGALTPVVSDMHCAWVVEGQQISSVTAQYASTWDVEAALEEPDTSRTFTATVAVVSNITTVSRDFSASWSVEREVVLPEGLPEQFLHYDSRGPNNTNWNPSSDLYWVNPAVGDWTDANGVKQGSTPYASLTLTSTGTKTIDITPLAARWISTGLNRGAHFRGTGGDWAVQFAGRLHADTGARPSLTVTTTTGTFICLARATAHWIHSSVSRYDGTNIWQVQRGQRSAIVSFDLSGVTGTVLSAMMSITCVLWNRNTTIAVFESDPPQYDAGGYRDELGFAQNYDRDVGIENHPSVLYAHRDWSTLSGWHEAINTGRGHTLGLVDPDTGLSYVRARTPGGNQDCLNLTRWFMFGTANGSEPTNVLEEIWCRYRLYLEPDWKSHINTNKIPGVDARMGWWNHTIGRWEHMGGNGGARNDGRAVRLASGGIGYQGHMIRGHSSYYDPNNPYRDLCYVRGYVYHIDQHGNYGDAPRWGNCLIERGKWYDLELHLKMNSLVGPELDELGNREAAFDGVYEAWVDGTKFISRKDMRWRRHPQMGFSGWNFSMYHGGTEKAPFDMHCRWSNFVAATEYIGPVRIS